MKLLITGGSGFIGQHLTRRFAGDLEFDVYAPREVHMNLTNPTQIDAVVGEYQPDVVLHLAAKTEVAWSFDDYLNVSNVNYLGTVALAEANRRLNPNLRLFVLASTMETYGHQPHGVPFTEETVQRPAAPATEPLARTPPPRADLGRLVVCHTRFGGRASCPPTPNLIYLLWFHSVHLPSILKAQASVTRLGAWKRT